MESPARYLSGERLETAALDALMMTQGWRRYDIPRVLKGDIDTPDIYRVVGEGVTASGKIIGFNKEITIESSIK